MERPISLTAAELLILRTGVAYLLVDAKQALKLAESVQDLEWIKIHQAGIRTLEALLSRLANHE